MAPRFIAIQFNARNENDRVAAQEIAATARSLNGWRCSLERSGLLVFDNCSDEAAKDHRVTTTNGLVIGTVFPMPGAAPVQNSLRQLADAASQARAANMLRTCWGRYVAFFADNGETSSILRDPSGRDACYILALPGSVRIAFADIEDVLPLVGSHLAIDWSYLDRFLVGNIVPSRTTGLRNVRELLPGECFTLQGDRESFALLWDPATFATDRIDDFEEASRAIRQVSQFCTDRWSERHRRILLSLSGGLDSSVMAGLLKQSPASPHVFCRNLFSDLVEADERHFARLVAEMHGFPLVTGKHGMTSMDFEMTFRDTPLTLNPSRAFTTVAAVQDRQTFLDSIGADSFWSGFGGDQIFSAEKNPSFARDYLHNTKLPIRLLQVARDASEISGKSIATVLRLALTPNRETAAEAPVALSFYANRLQQAKPPQPATEHPLLRNCTALPPAKMGHVLSTVFSLAANPFAKVADRPVVDFYASQPLLEMSLRVPSYVHNHGGVRRSIQRHAFADILPDAVRTRRGKGSAAADISANTLRPSNLAFMRRTVSAGHLMARGILDPERTRRLLAFERPAAIQDMNALITCLAAEDWLSKMQQALPH